MLTSPRTTMVRQHRETVFCGVFRIQFTSPPIAALLTPYCELHLTFRLCFPTGTPQAHLIYTYADKE